MKKISLYFIGLFVLCISFTPASSQNSLSISGIIKDNNGKGLNHASVSLLKAKDSSLVKTELTDENGKFEINALAQQQYLLLCTNVGYIDKYSEIFTPDKNYGITLKMEAGDKKLQEVTVTATKPMIEIKADRTVFNR